MKKTALLFLFATVFLFSNETKITYAESVEKPGFSGNCNDTGYKIWKDPGLFGNQNFYDCQCTLRRGKDPVACM